MPSYDADFWGSVGEEAVSSIMRLDWDGKHFTFEDWLQWRKTGNDVSGLEVKCTNHPRGRLWVRPNDNKPGAIYVLAKADKFPVVTLEGWAYGREIRQETNLEEGLYGRPAYYLSTRLLHPIDELLTSVRIGSVQTG